MKRLLIIITLFVYGCTAQIPSLSNKLSEERLRTKNCYKWSVMKTDIGFSVAMGVVIGILIPPLGLALGLTYIASDYAVKNSTKKCDLTTEEAMEQAAVMSYIENGDVAWWTHISPDESIYASKPLPISYQDESFRDCKVTEIKTKFAESINASMKYHITSYYSVCRNKEGNISVANKSFSETDYKQVVKIIQNAPPLSLKD